MTQLPIPVHVGSEPLDHWDDLEARQRQYGVWRFHAFFTTADPTVLDTVTADMVHRGDAIIEQVHADLKNSALAHLPSGVFTANAAWLVLAVIAFNLTRAAAALTTPDLARASIGSVRRTLIQIRGRVATSARRIIIHLPRNWPWQSAWAQLKRPRRRPTHRRDRRASR